MTPAPRPARTGPLGRAAAGSAPRAVLRGAALPALLAALVMILAAAVPAGAAATGRPLGPDAAMYPRVVRLAHNGAANGRILTTVTGFPSGGPAGDIYGSDDGGRSFTRVGRVSDTVAARTGLCCTTLYELPRRIGALPRGTLLWAGSVGQGASDPRMSLRIWRSTDAGRNWQYLSTAAASPNAHGLWEPEFTVAADGRLVMYYSDETDQPAHSQFLAEKSTRDGVHWSASRAVVRSDDPALRPGMATVRRLPTGTYVMTYEICGTGRADDCVVHLRTSRDAWQWGDPAAPGSVPTDAAGEHFAHTPTLAWSAGGGREGTLFLTGQMLVEQSGTAAPGTGGTIFTSTGGGRGTWQAHQAPVSVSDVRNDPCPNYSPALLPSPDGHRVLEITTDYDESGSCRAYSALGTLTPGKSPIGRTTS
ncbi:sialidase family protein [Streptomyces sp. NPDC006743]|uniref:sialidase family protein n=1 Tax=Streptomyces sp. NPDC006743 TaxID=3154480 RepID=UPI0034560290